MASIGQGRLRDLTEGWTKWQVAACVGAPIALGLAGLWFYNRSKTSKPKEPNAAFKGKGDAQKPPVAPVALSDKEKAQNFKTKGNKHFRDGKYEDAIECYTEAIKICPADIKTDLSTFYQNRAAAHENLGKYDEVIKDCDSALELNAKYSKALARRSKAKEQLEMFRESLEDITKACLIEAFQNQTYLQAADRVLKALGKNRAITEFKTKKAIKPSTFYVENYLQGFSQDPVALCFASEKSNNEKTLEELGVQVKDETDNIGENGAVLLEKPSAFDRAKICLANKEFDKILSLCDEELSSDSSSNMAECLLLRGTFRLLQAMSDLALEDLEKVSELEGASPQIKSTALIRAGSLKMQKSSDEAILNYFEKAEEICPDNSDVFHHYGQQLLQLEKLDEAIAKFDKSIKLSPGFPTSFVQKYFAVHRKAILKEDLSLLTEAKSGFEKTITDFPECSDALILYAQALSDQGKFDEAEKMFIKAHEVAPRNANNIVHRGLMSLQWKGDVQKTMKLLDEALAIDPTCQYAYEIRGTIEVQRGNLTEAVKSFKQAIALSNSESEMAHLFSLMEAAEVQVKVAKDLHIRLPSPVM